MIVTGEDGWMEGGTPLAEIDRQFGRIFWLRLAK